jgi:hypothetical protein
MKKEDEPNTSFKLLVALITTFGCPRGSKNAGGSFSRMTAKVLHSK